MAYMTCPECDGCGKYCPDWEDEPRDEICMECEGTGRVEDPYNDDPEDPANRCEDDDDRW